MDPKLSNWFNSLSVEIKIKILQDARDSPVTNMFTCVQKKINRLIGVTELLNNSHQHLLTQLSSNSIAAVSASHDHTHTNARNLQDVPLPREIKGSTPCLSTTSMSSALSSAASAPFTCLNLVVDVLNTRLRNGVVVGGVSAGDIVVPIVLKNTKGIIYCHEGSQYVSQEHLDAFVSRLLSRMDGAGAPRFACFVVQDDINIPGCSDFCNIQVVRHRSGSRCLAFFVSGVEENTQRLIDLLLMASVVAGETTTELSSNNACENDDNDGENASDTKTSGNRTVRMYEKQIAHLLNLLHETLNETRQTIHKQTEMQNFAKGISDSSHIIVQNLNNRIHMVELFLKRHKMHTGGLQGMVTCSSVEHQLEAIKTKMYAAWDDLSQRGLNLSRDNTVSSVMRIFPGQIQGFKNSNCLANTLRYYNTTFTKERETYLKNRDEV